MFTLINIVFYFVVNKRVTLLNYKKVLIKFQMYIYAMYAKWHYRSIDMASLNNALAWWTEFPVKATVTCWYINLSRRRVGTRHEGTEVAGAQPFPQWQMRSRTWSTLYRLPTASVSLRLKGCHCQQWGITVDRIHGNEKDGRKKKNTWWMDVARQGFWED